MSWSHYLELIKIDDENKTVGILLSTKRNKTVVKYTLPLENDSIYATEYKLHLPTVEELVGLIENEIKNFELEK